MLSKSNSSVSTQVNKQQFLEKDTIPYNEKLELFYIEVKDMKKFEEKIKSFYLNEFEDKIISILLTKESEFISNLKSAVKAAIEDIYSEESLGHKAMKEVLLRVEKFIVREVYNKHHRILAQAWKDYQANLEVIKKYSFQKSQNFVKISSKNKENFSYLKHYLKHCKFSEEFAFHNCENKKAKLLEVMSEDKKGKDCVTHVICIECKKTYLSSCIMLSCNFCNVDYFSYKLSEEEDSDLQPATWEKYHCGILINDKMKCIKCRNVFYIDLKTNKLVCLNKKCKLEARPEAIAWSCMVCKNEFKCEAKIYNPLEFKLIKNSIKLALLQKQRARPTSVPCCKINVFSRVFFHKKECQGELFQGDLKKKSIVVCEKCKSMNFYEKYIWTCPKCNKRFRQKEAGRCRTNLSSNLASANISPEKSAKIAHTASQSEMNVINLIQSNCMTRSNSISNYNKVDMSNPENLEELRIKMQKLEKKEESPEKEISNTPKKLAKIKTLREILEERKKKEGNLTPTPSCKLFDHSDLYNTESSKDLNQGLKNNYTESYSSENTIKESHNEAKIIKILEKNLSKEVSEEEKKHLQAQDKEEKPENKSSDRKTKSKKILQCKVVPEGENFDLNGERIKEINIDDYEIIKEIGAGSYGKIYLVQDRSRRKFAMKKIIAHDNDELEGIKMEFELVHSVKHENIMKIYGMNTKNLDSTTYALYILMELAKSDWNDEVKSRFVNRMPYTEEELFNIIKQLVKGLAYLQNNKISHRDLKPQNLLVFPNNVYKVADFGEAKEVKLYRQMNTLRGTELYMAPILLKGLKDNKDDVSHNAFKSDVFSLGYCLLYAATLTFNSVYEVRDLINIKQVRAVISKYLKNKYSSKLIDLIIKMIDFEEYERLDFNGLEKYLEENVFS